MRKELFVGAISGTSVDGLDLAILEIGDSINILTSITAPIQDDLRTRLLALGQPGHDNLDDCGSADTDLGRAIGYAINTLLQDVDIDKSRVAAIGSHGQTVRHRPEGHSPFTWQIGDPNQIAEITGITTIADFRRRDLAAGGQAAPLVPPFHDTLFRSTSETRVILNIGGISNVTVLPMDPAQNIMGFDTGPGNALLDSWVNQHQKVSFDALGAWAASGNVHRELLNDLLQDPYLSRAPPKSTGREHYNLAWLTALNQPHDPTPTDTQATLAEFTARTIADALETWGCDCTRILVCGGGRHNADLLRRLRKLTAPVVETTDKHGVDGDGLEAAAFAWLAHQTLNGLPGNDASVTGAKGARILGGIYQP